MSSRDTDARPVGLVDLPLVVRLTDDSTVLDSTLGYTRDVHGPNGALLSSILLPQRGLHTLIARADKQQAVGQFRVKSEGNLAHIVYIAPELEPHIDDTAWLHIFDAMAREAGKHHVHALIAEVNEDDCLFETMRTAGFAVYARQQIWRRLPDADHHPTGRKVSLKAQTDADVPGILALFSATVPGMLQQVVTLGEDGMVFRKNDRVEAYITLSEGKNGIYLTPYMHPEISDDAPDIFAEALRMIRRVDKVPVFINVRRHQNWFTMSLRVLGFEPGPQQAVMVRHITAGVRHAKFESVERVMGLHPAKPSTRPLEQRVLQSKNNERQE